MPFRDLVDIPFVMLSEKNFLRQLINVALRQDSYMIWPADWKPAEKKRFWYRQYASFYPACSADCNLQPFARPLMPGRDHGLIDLPLQFHALCR